MELRSISVPYDDDVESTTNKVFWSIPMFVCDLLFRHWCIMMLTCSFQIKIHEGYAKQKYYTGNFNCESHDIDRTKKDAVSDLTLHFHFPVLSVYRKLFMTLPLSGGLFTRSYSCGNCFRCSFSILCRS